MAICDCRNRTLIQTIYILAVSKYLPIRYTLITKEKNSNIMEAKPGRYHFNGMLPVSATNDKTVASRTSCKDARRRHSSPSVESSPIVHSTDTVKINVQTNPNEEQSTEQLCSTLQKRQYHERQRKTKNWSRLEESNEILQLNAMWELGLSLEQQKKWHLWVNLEFQIRPSG